VNRRQRLLVLVHTVFVSVMLVTPSTLSAQGDTTIAGRVTAEHDNQPVIGARVSVQGTSRVTVTDSSGAFELAGVASGSHVVVVSSEGFETIRATITVQAEASNPLEVRLPSRIVLREEVAVVAPTVGELGLRGVPATAGRLPLQALDIPASIDTLDSTVMNARGYQKVSDAVSRMAGVVSGEHPTAPSSFVIRGFTANQVSTLRDGIWLGPSTMIMRPQNTFNLDRVELLRGPSSVINGQGAVAGTINAITKAATPTSETSWQGLVTYGQFDTYQAAGGVTGPVNDSLWYRVDVSRSGSGGYVDRMDSGSTNVTGNLLWRPLPRARITFSADYLDDDLPKYFGTPLVPAAASIEPMNIIRTTTGEALDARTRFVSYNVADGYAQSRQVLLRSDVAWDLSSALTLSNVVYGFDADRRWKNAEGYVYCTAVVDVCNTIGDIQRYYGYFLINHDQQLFGDRLLLNMNAPLRGHDHHAVVGVEAYTLDFERTRGFRIAVPPAPGDSVDLLNPTPGNYGPEEIRGISPTGIDSWALFLEDSVSPTSRLRLTGALRYDTLDLDRRNLAANRNPTSGGFQRQFTWWSWRAGTVFTLTDGLNAYGQFSTAKDPVSANIFLVNANQNFDLTTARQWEAGIKANVRGGQMQMTAAYFDIQRDDVLQSFAIDSATNIGGIDAKGIELAGTSRLGARASVGANVGYTSSSYRPSANFVAMAGNRPPNVPRATANAWASYHEVAGRPIEVGGSLRFVGDRYADNANQLTMTSFALGDVYVAWTRGRLRATLRIDNISNSSYAAWSDVFYLGQTDPSFLYANQLLIGAPRTVSLMFQAGL
jgi:iron complex outermembrane receptor protein